MDYRWIVTSRVVSCIISFLEFGKNLEYTESEWRATFAFYIHLTMFSISVIGLCKSRIPLSNNKFIVYNIPTMSKGLCSQNEKELSNIYVYYPLKLLRTRFDIHICTQMSALHVKVSSTITRTVRCLEFKLYTLCSYTPHTCWV